MKKTLSVSLLSSLVLFGCNTDIAGDGLGAVSLKFASSQSISSTTVKSLLSTRLAVTSSVGSITVTDTAGNTTGTIDITGAWAVVKEIQLKQEGEDDSSEQDEVEYQGPYALDMLTGTTYPALTDISIPTGTYNNIEFKIEKLDSEDVVGMSALETEMATTLQNYSLQLTGSYSSADGVSYVDIPFSLSLSDGVEFSLAGTNSTVGFVIDDQGANDIIVNFQLNDWFRFDNTETNSDALVLESAITNNGTSDVLILSSSNNSDIMDVIKDNIEESAKYGEDEDENGELDHDENDDDSDDYDDDHENDNDDGSDDDDSHD